MLVLSRRSGEQILIAGNIRLTVLEVKGNQVCLGITAPSSVPVTRRELLAERSEDAVATIMDSPAPRLRGDL